MTCYRRTLLAAIFFSLGLSAALVTPAQAARLDRDHAPRVQVKHRGIDVHLPDDLIRLRLLRGNVLQVHVEPGGSITPPSLVIAPDAPQRAAEPVTATRQGNAATLASAMMRVELNTQTLMLSIYGTHGADVLLRQANLADLAHRRLILQYAKGAPFYGIHGFTAAGLPLIGQPDCTTAQYDTSGLLRYGRQVAKACPEGGDGAPFVWSTRGFGLLVDSEGTTFDLQDGNLSVSHTSRPDLDYYVIVGRPDAIFAGLADISGHAQLFPKWAMGFTNSQWGIDETELLHIVKTYRAKDIPIDNFTMDFDWKAWGEDHYGEFRWNETKFPDGPSGRLARMMAAQGMHITGIMKPRIHIDTVEGRYATAHDFWAPGEKASLDYASHKMVRDLDFDKPAVRKWFGDKAITYGFDKGIAGWWNDEADELNDDNQLLNMERSLYDAQRAHSNIRVWSINRSFWLGAQRYAYGLWSGDIQTGFKAMARQRQRMLNAIDLGEMNWGMDGGGFQGHPSDQNYARWIEFGAFTPIFRVHGTYGEKRQPWRYGPVAEKAAKHAIRLHYALIPYIYSYAWRDHAKGVGLVTPLFFEWPDDTHVSNDVNSWMFGQWLLVSPVVKKDQTEKHVYLPAGTWTEYFSGKVYQGGQTITIPVQIKTWDDIPLFIRQGAIIPTQKVLEYVGQTPIQTVNVDVFPSMHRTRFNYYDDGGKTYAYAHGDYFLQPLSVKASEDAVTFRTGSVRGSFKPVLKHYLVKIHGSKASAVFLNDHKLDAVTDLQTLREQDKPGWCTGHDLYGYVTYIKLPAGKKLQLRIQNDTGM